VILYFAYGSNMSRNLMRARCPGAQALGTGVLAGWHFMITADRYASIVPRPGRAVHGVLWRIGAREMSALNAYESVDSGLYRRRRVMVRCGRRSYAALLYVARPRGPGRPRPAYLDVVVAAAREWRLPDDYIRSVARWSPGSWRGGRPADTGELG
jgi:gamma-glutamylcyclotransferase (GGCT)/AIG2-like uncharacterized protein YtfP